MASVPSVLSAVGVYTKPESVTPGRATASTLRIIPLADGASLRAARVAVSCVRAARRAESSFSSSEESAASILVRRASFALVLFVSSTYAGTSNMVATSMSALMSTIPTTPIRTTYARASARWRSGGRRLVSSFCIRSTRPLQVAPCVIAECQPDRRRVGERLGVVKFRYPCVARSQGGEHVAGRHRDPERTLEVFGEPTHRRITAGENDARHRFMRPPKRRFFLPILEPTGDLVADRRDEIGRASCRERVE